MQPVAGSHANPWDAFSTQFRARHEQLAAQRQSGEAQYASGNAKAAMRANEVDPSQAVQETSGANETQQTKPEAKDPAAEAEAAKSEKGGPNDLTEEQQKMVRELQARDREVRAHEQAHATVGGQYAGAPSYTYQSGPDGKQYAIGGEVAIDMTPIKGDPEATIDKMQIVIAAALAPAEPSGQDRKVASAAQSMQAQAYGELMAERAAERSGEIVDTKL